MTVRDRGRSEKRRRGRHPCPRSRAAARRLMARVAEAELAETLEDEPGWKDVLSVVRIELGERDRSHD